MKEPVNAKKIRSAAEAMGFETFTFKSTVTKDATLWAKNGDGHKAGDVRIPAKEVDAWVIRARHPKAPERMAFEVIYADGFRVARVIDPIGLPRTVNVDYSYNETEIKSYGYTREYADRKSHERDAAYNDNFTIVKHRYRIESATEMYRWIDEMLDLLKVQHKRLTPKPRKAKQKSLLDDFDGGDWVG